MRTFEEGITYLVWLCLVLAAIGVLTRWQAVEMIVIKLLTKGF